MSFDAASVARAKAAFFKRRSLLKMAGAAAGAATLGGSLPSGSLAQSTPEVGTDLGAGGTVPAAPGYDLPLAEPGSLTYTFATVDNYYSAKSYNENLPVWAEIEARTGIKIEWQATAGSDYDDAMAVRIGANSDLPDFLRIPNGMQPVLLGTDGIALPLNDLIDQHAPNIKAFLEEFPDIKRMMTAPDGNIYAIPSVVSDAGQSDPYGLLIRQDWLDQLGLERPTTLEEWYTTLKRFKVEILEANGVNDVAPLLGGNGNLDAILEFGVALGLKTYYSLGWQPDADGKITYDWVDDRMKEVLIWVNRLYTEGLIDPRFHESSHDDRLQLVTTNNVGADVDFLNRATEWNTIQAQAGNTDAQWVIVQPPVSEQHTTSFYELYGPLSGWFMISSRIDQPEIAIKWMDYIWASDEGNTLVTYGLEDVTYTVGDNDRLVFTDWVTDNPDGLDPSSALRFYGAYPNTPWTRAASGPLSGVAWDVLAVDPVAYANAQEMAEYLVPQYPLIQPTREESDENADILADLNTYMWESLLKFALGQESIEEGWADYVDTMKSLGLDRLIEVQQGMYDRYLAS
jgi:putative aldouronate transport system substrate-binding protein